MRNRRQKTKRTDRTARRQGNSLVYKRTEIDSQKEFDLSKIYYALVFITLVSIIYLVFFSGAFSVSAIDVKGTIDIKPENIRSMVGDKLDSQLFKKNIFLFDSDTFTRELKKKYSLKKAKVKKNYPNKVSVELDEYVPELSWLSSGKYYLIDEKGKAVGEYTKPIENTPIVEDKKNLPVQVGKSLVTTDFINFIKYLNTNFSQIKNAKITKIEINESFNEVNVYSSLGYYIIFDTTRNPETELKNLGIAVNSKDLQKGLSYIDMRVKNKIFYK